MRKCGFISTSINENNVDALKIPPAPPRFGMVVEIVLEKAIRNMCGILLANAMITSYSNLIEISRPP